MLQNTTLQNATNAKRGKTRNTGAKGGKTDNQTSAGKNQPRHQAQENT